MIISITLYFIPKQLTKGKVLGKITTTEIYLGVLLANVFLVILFNWCPTFNLTFFKDFFFYIKVLTKMHTFP